MSLSFEGRVVLVTGAGGGNSSLVTCNVMLASDANVAKLFSYIDLSFPL